MLRRIQALAALLWIGYGILIHAAPVIVANLVVAAGRFVFFVWATIQACPRRFRPCSWYCASRLTSSFWPVPSLRADFTYDDLGNLYFSWN